jgi:hypothetical protein
VRPIAVGPCPGAGAHEGHQVIAAGVPVGPEGNPRGLLTIWYCPVDRWGGYWHDLRYRAEDRGGAGPSLEELPPRRRRLRDRLGH